VSFVEVVSVELVEVSPPVDVVEVPVEVVVVSVVLVLSLV